MKTYKLILSALALVAVLSVNAFAQTSVAVTAEVKGQITVANEQDVAFGNISANLASYLQAHANDGTATANIGQTAQAGQVSIAGADLTNVKITFSATATLTDGGLNSATFTPTVYYNGTAISSADDVILTAAATDLLDIGGSLTAITDAGAYSTGSAGGSPIVVTVQHN